jgi:hypothetical protein
VNIFYIALAAVFSWLLVLSVILFWFYRFSRKIVGDADKADLSRLLKKIIDEQKKNKNAVIGLEKEIKRVDFENLRNIQKVALVRFNPFNELGGDHSFVLALVDGNHNGVVLTGLHTRDRTRVYLKEIKGGKSKYKLSKEEQKALDEVVLK